MPRGATVLISFLQNIASLPNIPCVAISVCTRAGSSSNGFLVAGVEIYSMRPTHMHARVN